MRGNDILQAVMTASEAAERPAGQRDPGQGGAGFRYVEPLGAGGLPGAPPRARVCGNGAGALPGAETAGDRRGRDR